MHVLASNSTQWDHEGILMQNNSINLVSACLNHIINHLENPYYYEILFISLILNVKTKMVTKPWTWTEIKALKCNSWCVKIIEIRWRFKKQKIRWKAENYFFEKMYFWNVSLIKLWLKLWNQVIYIFHKLVPSEHFSITQLKTIDFPSVLPLLR